jgi:hypothetical protein
MNKNAFCAYPERSNRWLVIARSRWVVTAPVLALGVAFATSCTPAPLGPGYPLYPNPQLRRSDDRVSRLVGPIGSVDGQDVSAQGEVFDLLPGCHVVQLHGEMNRNNGNAFWVGPVPRFVFALRMKAGHRYIIWREFIQNMSSTTGRVVAFAHEEDSAGDKTPLSPIQSRDEIRACKEWGSGAN